MRQGIEMRHDDSELFTPLTLDACRADERVIVLGFGAAGPGQSGLAVAGAHACLKFKTPKLLSLVETTDI